MPDRVNEMTETQKEVLDSIKEAYERYNQLVTRVIETVDGDYDSVYDLKKAILTALSNSLGGR